MSKKTSSSITQPLQQALQHYQQGRLPDAAHLYQQVLKQDNKNADELNLLGITLAQLKQIEQAEQFIKKAIKINKKVANYHYNLGIILENQTKYSEAIACFQQAIRLEPNNSQIHLNLGNIFNKQEKYDEAILCYQRVVQLNPNYPEVYNNLGTLLFKQNKIEQALNYYNKALSLKNDFVDVYNNLGMLFEEQNRFQDALIHYQRAIELNPDLAETYTNIAHLLYHDNQYFTAINYLHHSLKLKSHSITTYNLLAEVLCIIGSVSESLEYIRKSLLLKTNQPKIHNNLIFVLNSSIEQNRATLFAELQRFNEQHAKPLVIHIKSHNNLPNPNKKLKIGYVSSDFRRHSVAYFAESILKNHDHTQFEVFCYHNHETSDDFTRRFQSYADHWCDCNSLSDEELAEQIRQDGIDILIDLNGHTAGNRLLVFARKPAPIQATYVGFPNSTGLTTIDYHITDSYFDPIGIGEQYHSEQLLRMSNSYHCYTPNEDSPEFVELPAINNGYVTFCSFNKFEKISPVNIKLWIQLLKMIPTAKFMVKNHALENLELQEKFLQSFTQQGIEAHRLILGSEPNTLATLHAYNQADITLDTYPYNGCTTTCQSLWMGVPVVSLVGETHVARAGLSLLTAADFPEFIAYNEQQYIDIAVNLANNVERLQHIRQTMREKLRTSPLMDHQGFTEELENHYHQIWQRWCEYC